MKVTQDAALSLLNKYVEKQTPVFAALVTSSVSVARVTGTIRISIADGVPRLVIGEDGNESDQIKFRLYNCVFEYSDFRGEPEYLRRRIKGRLEEKAVPVP